MSQDDINDRPIIRITPRGTLRYKSVFEAAKDVFYKEKVTQARLGDVIGCIKRAAVRHENKSGTSRYVGSDWKFE